MYLPDSTPLPLNGASPWPAWKTAAYDARMMKWSRAFDPNRQNCDSILSCGSLQPAAAVGPGIVPPEPSRNLMSANGMLGPGAAASDSDAPSSQSVAIMAASQMPVVPVTAASATTAPSTVLAPTNSPAAVLARALTPSQMADVNAAPKIILPYKEWRCPPTTASQWVKSPDYAAPGWGNSGYYPSLAQQTSFTRRGNWFGVGLVAVGVVALLSLFDRK